MALAAKEPFDAAATGPERAAGDREPSAVQQDVGKATAPAPKDPPNAAATSLERAAGDREPAAPQQDTRWKSWTKKNAWWYGPLLAILIYNPASDFVADGYRRLKDHQRYANAKAFAEAMAAAGRARSRAGKIADEMAARATERVMQQREYALEEAAARANREVYSKNKFLAKADARADRIIAYRRAGVEPWFAGTLEAAAVDEIRAAAESGDPKQQERLGLMYLFGLGVPQSEADAATWTRRAAAKGYTVAETNLGAMYGNGWGVPQDTDRAIKWYKEAAAHGDLDAKKSLRSLVGARPDQDRLRGHRP